MVKGISLNSAYRGRRFATPALECFKEAVWYELPKTDIDYTGKKLKIDYEFGVSSKNADGDNLVKAFQDVLASFYSFNDKQVYKWSGEKVDVKKGEEYCAFDIKIIE